MKGLLKNNYFAVRSNAKAFSVFMLLLGIQKPEQSAARFPGA
jgi:hypothetical protein